MRSLSRNSKWTSKTYSQEPSDSNWKLATPTIEAKHKKIILEDESTPTSLVSRQNIDVQAGDKLLVKLSDNSYQEVVAEAVSVGTSALELNFPQGIITTQAYYNAVGNKDVSSSGTNLFSDDGLTMWSGSSSLTTGVAEFKMTTPFDVLTLYPTGNSLGKGGFFFSQDGKILVTASQASYSVEVYRLSIPWEFSSVIGVETVQPAGTSFNFGWNTGAISADGKIALFASSSAIYRVVLEVPFEFSSGSVVTTINSISNFVNVYNIQSNSFVFMTSDGRYMYAYYDDAAALSAYMKRMEFIEPFNIFASIVVTTLATGANTANNFGYNIYPGTSNDLKSRVIYSNDMRNFTVVPTNGSSQTTIVPATTKWNDSTIIDISTAGLTEVPTEVIQLNDFTVSLASELSSDRTKTRSEPLWLEYSSATSSSAVVGHSSPGKVQIGDTLLFNGTDSVTVTGVTETAGGLPYIGLGEPDGNKYLNVRYVQGNPDHSTAFGSSPKMTFSPDGTRLLVAYGNQNATDREYGVKCYNLSTPWDISTLFEDTRPIISSKTLGYSSSLMFDVTLNSASGGGWLGIQFSPDGTKLYTFINRYYYMNVSEAVLSVPWDPYTIISASSVQTNAYSNTLSSTSSTRMQSMYIDPISGSEVVWTQFNSDNTLTNTAFSARYSLSSPWDPISNWPAAAFSMATSNYIGFNASRSDSGNGDGTLNGYRGIIQRFNSDRSVVVYCGSGGNNPGFGTNNFRCKKDFAGIDSKLSSADSVDSVTMDNRPDTIITDAYISPDGTRFYALSTGGLIYEYQIRAETLNKYEITFAPQAQAPTSIQIPGRGNSVSLSPEIASVNSDSVNITWSSDPIDIDSRALQIQVDGAGPSTEISTIRLDLFTEL